ncbi:ABC transporter ATP-binding protein [Halomonas sp.]|uniref:ABC transporter ATP-binding protein n=1 Tax=Halomonas sp. TaxID=1486246 RepID=UPI00298D6E00|nr:ABC transporter ATP-binding protein [Halomonas sp.]MDW7745664.1 ABC transporter ATP-binding protein [Halomonas sp.]
MAPSMSSPSQAGKPARLQAQVGSGDAGTQAPRLSAQNLRLGYTDKVIVPDMTLDFEPARIHCLIGPNGCGKSTLLRALAGLMTPQNGQALLNGRAVTSWPRRHLARRLAMLPQHPKAPEGLSVEQLVRKRSFQGVPISACLIRRVVAGSAPPRPSTAGYLPTARRPSCG